MRRSGFSNSDVLVIVRWMVQKRLLETLCEADPTSAFDVRIKDDFGELMESGAAVFIEASYDRQKRILVSVHFGDCRYEFGATAADGRIQIDRRSNYFEVARSPRSRDKSA